MAYGVRVSLERKLSHLHGVLSVEESAEAFWVNVTDLASVQEQDVFPRGCRKSSNDSQRRTGQKANRLKTTLSGKRVFKVLRVDVVGTESALWLALEEAQQQAKQKAALRQAALPSELQDYQI